MNISKLYKYVVIYYIMTTYNKLKLSDIIKSETLNEQFVEVSGVAVGLQHAPLSPNLNTTVGANEYSGFLYDLTTDDMVCENVRSPVLCGTPIYFKGKTNGIDATKDLSMLAASSEIKDPVTLRGKLVGGQPYTLEVSGIKFGDYKSMRYDK
jgi:hypothetical protein